jgi:hypothetical protein
LFKITPFLKRRIPIHEPEEPIPKIQPKVMCLNPNETDEVLLIWGSLSTETRIDLGNKLNIMDLGTLYKSEKVRNYLIEHHSIVKTKPILRRRNT